VIHPLLTLLGWAIVATIPLLGVWVASSLAAFHNGPIWLTVLAGSLLFPILPGAWELRAHRKRKRKPPAEQATQLTLSDRLILRTWAVNILFLAALLATFPQAGFTALSTRGDWMLDGRHDPDAEQARADLFWTADKLEWLYEAARDNPFDELLEPHPDDDGAPEPPDLADHPDLPEPGAGSVAATAGASGQSPGANGTGGDTQGEAAAWTWPLPAEPHPAAVEVLSETDVDAVAAHVKNSEPDPFLRFKALHDYVALRTTYDIQALAAGRYPPQDAETVLRTGTGVCAGYANALLALGVAAGYEVAFVAGDSRDMGGDVGGGGHAWNAVKIDGGWYLVDATWNAGYVEGTTFVPNYGTEYLFTPANMFVIDHLPDDDRWQLLRQPLNRGAFMRQPVLRPGFFQAGLKLTRPSRSQVSVGRSTRITIENPAGRYVLAKLRPKGATSGGLDLPVHAAQGSLSIECEFPSAGTWQVWLFVSEEEYGSYSFCGQLEVNSSQ
jgi:transglutaminase-like putative cysteine protease